MDNIHVNATMCKKTAENAEEVKKLSTGLYIIPTEQISAMISKYCSDHLRVRQGTTTYDLHLFIFGDTSNENKLINIVGGRAPDFAPSVSDSPVPTSSTDGLGTGWIVAIVLGCLLAVTVAALIGVLIYYCLRNRKVTSEEEEAIWKLPTIQNKLAYRSAISTPLDAYDTSVAPAVVNSSIHPYNRHPINPSGVYEFPSASNPQAVRTSVIPQLSDLSARPLGALNNVYSSSAATQGRASAGSASYGYPSSTNGQLYPRPLSQTSANRYGNYRL
ncbi:unnamed protein product [Toxocara canis]|nr:unnamed protein product [Toxocara canis]